MIEFEFLQCGLYCYGMFVSDLVFKIWRGVTCRFNDIYIIHVVSTSLYYSGHVYALVIIISNISRN